MSVIERRISIDAGPEALEEVHRFCLESLETVEGEEVRLSIQLVLEELVTNIIRHGYGEDREGPIDLRLQIGPVRVEAELRDGAPPFDPTAWNEPLDRQREGKRGLPLVRKLTHRFDYVRTGEGENLLSFEFLLHGEE